MEKFVRISFLLALGGAAMAADLTGTWTGHVPARNGQTDVVFQFQQMKTPRPIRSGGLSL